MLRLVFSQLLCLIWSVLCSGLVYECNFDGLKLKEGLKQNLSSSIAPLTFVRQLPLSRALSHSCIVKTDRKESFLHVKAKTHGETRGKLVCLPFHTDLQCCLLLLYDRTRGIYYHANRKWYLQAASLDGLMVKGFSPSYCLGRRDLKCHCTLRSLTGFILSNFDRSLGSQFRGLLYQHQFKMCRL